MIKMETIISESGNVHMLNGYRFNKENRANSSELWDLINILENEDKIRYLYNSETNQYDKEPSERNVIELSSGTKYIEVTGGSFAVLYDSREAQQQAKKEFEALNQKYESTTETQFPTVDAVFECPEGKGGDTPYGLYLSIEEPMLGISDDECMVYGVVLDPKTYIEKQLETKSTLTNVQKRSSDCLKHKK